MSFVSKNSIITAVLAESIEILTGIFAKARGPPLLFPTTVNKRDGGILLWA
jgi:hypothetical protein